MQRRSSSMNHLVILCAWVELRRARSISNALSLPSWRVHRCWWYRVQESNIIYCKETIYQQLPGSCARCWGFPARNFPVRGFWRDLAARCYLHLRRRRLVVRTLRKCRFHRIWSSSMKDIWNGLRNLSLQSCKINIARCGSGGRGESGASFVLHLFAVDVYDIANMDVLLL